jgi:hypothetical protein
MPIERALERFGGNRGKAAEALKISMVTLWRKRKQYGLTSCMPPFESKDPQPLDGAVGPRYVRETERHHTGASLALVSDDESHIRCDRHLDQHPGADVCRVSDVRDAHASDA